MATAGGQFKLDLDAWSALTRQQLTALARQSIMEIAERVVTTTPFDTGFLQSSWQPSLNVLPRPTDDDGGRSGVSSADPLARIGIVVQGLEAGDTFYLVNNARYAMRLEFGFVGPDALGRVYNQPGRYWVTRAVAQWPTIVEQTARDLGFQR